MEQIKKLIEAAAKTECTGIVESHGLFHTLHEAYGVCKEEYEEAREEMDACEQCIKEAWKATREDDQQTAFRAYMKAYKRAENAAAECTQIAAVCLKLLKGLDERKLMG